MGDGQYFLEFVTDENHTDAVVDQGPQCVEQTLALLGREHRGGFVEDQDTRAANQGLDDLHPLLFTHGEIRYQGVAVEGEAVLLADGVDACSHAGLVQHPPATGLAHHEVFQHGVSRHQMKMLMHHADTGGQGVGGGVDGDGFPADADTARVDGIQAEQDVHERGLAGAILTEQAQHLTGPQGQIHSAIGMHVAKALIDSAHLQQRRSKTRVRDTFSFGCSHGWIKNPGQRPIFL